MVTWCTYSVYIPQTLGHWKFAVHIHSNISLTSIFQLYICTWNTPRNHDSYNYINQNANGATFQLWITAWKTQPLQAKVSDIPYNKYIVYCMLLLVNCQKSTSGSISMNLSFTFVDICALGLICLSINLTNMHCVIQIRTRH